MTCEILRYKKLSHSHYFISGVISTKEDYCNWIAKTNDDFEIENADDLQILCLYSDQFIPYDDSVTSIELTIRKNRLNMLLNVKTTNIVQDINGFF